MSVPDENSNLNPPPPARRPSNRRRGRRGGRGRQPRSTPKIPAAPAAGEAAAAPESDETFAADNCGNETEISPAPDRQPEAAPAAPVENAPAENTRGEPGPPREARQFSSRPPSRVQEPRRPNPRPAYVKPADFRPADISAVSQAVELATQIAESLKQVTDQLDEILELVELAERQKLADEREIDQLRRALRRIQPPRYSRDEPREPRDSREPRLQRPPRGEPPESSEPDELREPHDD
jgi:hypothetical protein